MSFLQNVAIKTKILYLLIPLCLLGLGSALFVSYKAMTVGEAYSTFISKDARAEINVAIASQHLLALSNDTYKIFLQRAGSPELERASVEYTASRQRLFELLQGAIEANPDQAKAITYFVNRSTAIAKITDQGVAAGRIDNDDDAKFALLQADELTARLLPKMRDYINAESASIDEKSALLEKNLMEAVEYSILGLLSLSGLGIAFSLFVGNREISRPLLHLEQRMLALAAGDTVAPVEGLTRKDEVGRMACSVEVFRGNAIDRLRLENESDDIRNAAELERALREEQRSRETNDIRVAVEALAAGLQTLAEGNLAYRIEEPFVSELDAVRVNFNVSVEVLEKTLHEVGGNARAIDAGASEMRVAADDLSRRTEQQAASVEETAAALEQVTTTVRDTTKRAEEAGILVAQACDAADRSGEVVKKAVYAMEAIKQSASEITNIIGVIDEIAFQTNLLALNAGVEAARAGDAGKGFAVVAHEVRELAQRSAKAAKEIKQLINLSGSHVSSGASLVAQTGDALRMIVSEVKDIDRHVGAIVQAAREQSAGLQEINTAVNRMDQSNQQNAAMVEQSTAASHSLAGEAAKLTTLLNRFRIDPTSLDNTGIYSETRLDKFNHFGARSAA
ncbi:methyl-accepting chemotaxis protein [Agrobacterium rubi]|uniref:methyl-accepting chemotaxis protein n=1 Tax=Agrobacterium rubi TaxID=28099 RepID=UPI002355B6B5|nr:HAMP domain-containing methyl-accepting chemotaxis protein [Agrobacterium rubi]